MIGWIASAIGLAGDIGKEIIDTPLEKAQAQVLKLKELDPNGRMRRDLARFASKAYGFYLLVVSTLVLSLMFIDNPVQIESIRFAISEMTALFLPITGAWTAIVSASFGVNVSNNIKDMKLGKEST